MSCKQKILIFKNDYIYMWQLPTRAKKFNS